MDLVGLAVFREGPLDSTRLRRLGSCQGRRFLVSFGLAVSVPIFVSGMYWIKLVAALEKLKHSRVQRGMGAALPAERPLRAARLVASTLPASPVSAPTRACDRTAVNRRPPQNPPLR